MTDGLKRFIHQDGHFKVTICETTQAGRDAFARFSPSPIALQLIVRAMTGAMLLASNMKQEGSLQLSFSGTGPINQIKVEANTHGQIRGYAENPSLVFQSKERSLFESALGPGTLSVKRRLHPGGQLFESVVELVPGDMALNLAHYLLQSEQIPSAIQISASLDPNSGIRGAGGILIQAMPDANENLLFIIEARLRETGQLSAFFAREDGINQMREELFEGIPLKFLGDSPVEYFCPCDRQRMLQVFAALPLSELISLRDEGSTLTIRCNFCNQPYDCLPEDLDVMISLKYTSPPATD